jgi:hypothetical protein
VRGKMPQYCTKNIKSFSFEGIVSREFLVQNIYIEYMGCIVSSYYSPQLLVQNDFLTEKAQKNTNMTVAVKDGSM